MLDEFESETPPQRDSQRRLLGRAPIYREPLLEDDWPDEPPRRSGRLAKAGYALFVLALTASLLWVLERSVEQTTAIPEGSSRVATKEGGGPPVVAETEPAITIPAPKEPAAPDPGAAPLPVDRANRVEPRTPPPLSARGAPPTTPSPSSSRIAGLLPRAIPGTPSREAAPVDSAAVSQPSPRTASPEPIRPRPPIVETPTTTARVTGEPSAPPPAPPGADPSAALPRVAIEDPTLLPPVTPPVEPVSPAPAPRAAATPPPAAAASAAAAIEGERSAIRDALGRYRSAYNALDASAARRVWPTVNQQSLSKAFAQLAQQTVAFESCTIDVRGVLAEAICNGSTRFVPRVGGRSEQVMARRWSFRLRKAAEGGWLIHGVDVR